ncbi:MAG: DUF5683 domain-containing protein [Flavobacteriaceae bacterium]|nr:DUF5683 domain-containing protein [Flavobacteriaceae bacterium]
MFKKHIILLLFSCVLCTLHAQETSSDTLRIDTVLTKKQKRKLKKKNELKGSIDPLKPSKAAFYSAVLPGLGQAYNKRYWKIPIVWGALGAGIYAITYNDGEYNRFRSAFKRRKAGFIDDEFYDLNGSGIVAGEPDFSDEALQDAQERFQRDRDLSLLITIGLYVLNIIDANVDAHLKQFNVDENLSLDIKPYLHWEEQYGQAHYGMVVQIKF